MTLWDAVFSNPLSETIDNRKLNNVDLIGESINNYVFPTLITTFSLEKTDLAILNNYLAEKYIQYVYVYEDSQKDEKGINDAIDVAKYINRLNLKFIYPIYDNAEIENPTDYPDNTLKLKGAFASMASRWNFNNTTGTAHLKELSGVAPINVSQNNFNKLLSAGFAMNTDRGGKTAFTESRYGKFFDFWHNAYWLTNEIRYTAFNLLATTPSKVPYTQEGFSTTTYALEQILKRGIANSSIAPYKYDSIQGNPINESEIISAVASKGYYIEIQPIVPDDAKSRVAPLIKIWFHMNGAIHHTLFAVGVLK